MKKKKRIFLIVLCAFLGLCLLLGGGMLGINAYVLASGRDRILSREDAALLQDVDCILVLGCLVRSDGSPSDMLSDRLAEGVALYEKGAAPALFMSGDHGREDYDEVNAMRAFAAERGVPAEDVFMDHAGFSTYESLYRAKEIFGADKIVIVTQEYHLYRALYIADALGIEAYGVSADPRTYRNQWAREIREVMARCKDFFAGVFEPKPTYLGEPVDLLGDGNQTNG
jgi:vancomycin permeability regulator SanA